MVWKHICEHIFRLSEIYFYQKKRGGDYNCGKCCQVSQETEEKLKVYHLSFLLAQKFSLYNISSFLPLPLDTKVVQCNLIKLLCYGYLLIWVKAAFQFSSG